MNKPFGKMIDIIAWGIRGIVLYYILLIMNFWAYQDEDRTFRPMVCAGIILLSVIIGMLWYVRNKVLFVMAVAVSFAVITGVTLELADNFFLAVIMCVPIVDVILGKIYSLTQKNYINTFRQLCLFRCRKCMVVLCVLPLIGIVGSATPNEKIPLSFQNCMVYMSIAFIAYLILMIMMQYANRQYRYFSNYRVMNQAVYTKTKRMNMVVLAVSILIFGSIMLVVSETLVSIFTQLVGLVLYILLGGSRVLFNMIPWDSFLLNLFSEKDFVLDGTVVQVGAMKQADMGIGNIIDYVFGVIFLIAVIVFVMKLLKLYKVNLATYVTEDETAEYISTEEIHQLQKRYGKKANHHFKNDYNGKIRELYLRVIDGRISSSKAKEANKKTTTELHKEYRLFETEEKQAAVKQCYEKARYSGKRCEEKDYKDMKKWITGK